MASMPAPPLLQDLYQFTMAQAYLRTGQAGRRAVFELFFRRAPHRGAYAVAAGRERALEFVEGLRFGSQEIDYLRGLGLFGPDLLELLGAFRFHGDLWAVPEGTVVFPGEPLLRVDAPLLEAQLLETPLLNLLGFATAVATKAARIVLEAGPAEVVEFGCRRAQGPDGAFTATRSAFIGGCSSTSHLEAGRRLGIPVKGTMAHSFVMSFPSELEAFRAYARVFPESSVLLVDTYHTIESGIPSAIAVARELRQAGRKLAGVRLDSGDLEALSRESRRLLDAAGFPEVRIFASGDLDERRVRALRLAGAPIDAFGVGTRLAVSEGDPAPTCVYKLAALEDPAAPGGLRGLMKVTDDPAKTTLPGPKQVYRLFEAAGEARGDVMALDETIEPPPGIAAAGGKVLPLLEPCIREGRRLHAPPALTTVQALARLSLEAIPPQHRRIDDPLPYPVRLSPALSERAAAGR